MTGNHLLLVIRWDTIVLKSIHIPSEGGECGSLPKVAGDRLRKTLRKKRIPSHPRYGLQEDRREIFMYDYLRVIRFRIDELRPPPARAKPSQIGNAFRSLTRLERSPK